MNVIRTIWRWILSTKGRLQAFLDLLLLMLSPVIFVPLIGADLSDLDKDLFIITLIILCYTQVTRWFSSWYCERRKR